MCICQVNATNRVPLGNGVPYPPQDRSPMPQMPPAGMVPGGTRAVKKLFLKKLREVKQSSTT
eukprot:12912885-Prorocentrum_lima.AAC.1